PENPYAPFYPGPPTDQYIPCYWTPNPNQAFYAPSISQGIPPGWCHPPAFSTNGNNSCIYPRGYSAVPPNPAYLPPAHYYMYPVPAAAPTPLGPMDNYSPPCMPFPAQAPPSPRQQRVEVYAQQYDEVLRFLHLSPAEFARHTHTLLTNLGYPDTSMTPEVWADRLLDFHECYLQGNLLETMQGTLGIDDNLRNELHTLVEEIHTSPNPHPFEDPLDPAHSFHVQCGEPSIAFDHYTALLQFDPNNPVLSNWLAFIQEFSSKFGVFDTIAEAEENLFNLRMCNNEHFMTFIVRFEQEAYETGWNYNALQFALCHALPQRIKDVLHLAPKQTTYDGYKALVTQVNQRY
ncbi:hypothetical protein C0989_008351, partial [Termitomyces sp. Mn162]